MNERDLFIAALKKEAQADRLAYLDEACKGNDALRHGVDALLEMHERAGSFLDSPVSGLIDSFHPPIKEQPGTLIGPYKLLEQIGEGGFGIVFMADQQYPVRRKVALKIIKPGMDTRQVVARFEAERQALALMDHPNIARVLDAGATDSGRPYFVMELVPGVPITEFCDDHRLTPRERLELFGDICQAVQHAHQKGIIHRDLKPSNVLVTLHGGRSVVKVIDFGIAKALGTERLTEKTLATGLTQMVGTPLYMSPEQAEMSGHDADTRTDIYALGVLLYELLTGTTPFDKEELKEASYDEIRRIIREEEPAKPSTRINTLGQAATTVSANRKSEPRRLSQLFRGELDWIVMKALEKDRNRRYETASAFAADLERYLHDEPVQACPPSAVYRFRKFARRNKVALMAATAVALTVLLAVTGLALSTVLVSRANSGLSDSLERERQSSYFQRVALAEREWSTNDLTRVEHLLDACPADLRGWEWHYVKRLRLQGLSPLRHPTAVFSAVFSPDGRWIASGSQDGRLTVWDATSGQQLSWFQAHERNIPSVAFSPNGRCLATAGSDGTVKIWALDPTRAAGKHSLLQSLPGHPGGVQSVAFSPDSRHLASAGHDKTVRVWNVATASQTRSLEGHTDLVTCVAYSPDGQWIASASNDKSVKIWDAATGQEKLTLSRHGGAVWSVSFSGDGRWLATAGENLNTMGDCEVKVWDAQTGAEALRLRDPVMGVTSVAFSPDGRRLASGGFDCNVKLWDLATGQEAFVLRGHRGGVRSVAFSRDGNRIVSTSLDCSVRVWNATPLEQETVQEVCSLVGHDGGVHSVAFSPDGRYVASAGADATVRIWDFPRGLKGGANPPIRTLTGYKSKIWNAYNVAFSANGQLLAASGDGGPQGGWLKVWDTTSWTELAPIPNTSWPVAFSRDGRYLATGGGQLGREFPVKVWDAATRREIHTLKGNVSSINDVAFGILSDVPLLASGSRDGTLRIWNVKSGKEIQKLDWDTGGVRCAAFSPDGHFLASGGVGRVIRIWDTRTWELFHEQRDDTGCIHCVVFHPKDSRMFAWASTAGTVKVWDSATKEIRTLRGHTRSVESLAFSPDGKCIASASLDGTVKIWKVPALPKSAGPAEK